MNNQLSSKPESYANILDDRGIEHVKLGVFDGDGILRGSIWAGDKSWRRGTRASASAM